jgi:hypothetical protein
MIEKFRHIKKKHVTLGYLIEDSNQIFDTKYLLSLYKQAKLEAIQYSKERIQAANRAEELISKADELGFEVTATQKIKVPTEEAMCDVIEGLRLAYLAALLCKNCDKAIAAADNHTNNMSHTNKIITRKGCYSWGESWEYYVAKNFLTIDCDEEITEDCGYVRDDKEVLEWNGSGYDRDGDWRDSGFPSKWNTHVWRLPKSITKFTDIVWKDSEVPCNTYHDFRDMFFSTLCGGAGDGSGEYWDSLYPRVWDIFRIDRNAMQYEYAVNGIRWDGKTHVNKITINLKGDEKSVGKERKAHNENT